jgi:UDP-N-acetylglucosamine pyrophosphorylase
MFNFLFCTNCHTKEEEAQSAGLPPSLAAESKQPWPEARERGLRLDKQQVKVLQAYNQAHVVNAFDSLAETEKVEVMRCLALIHFDFVDLMFHNMVLKSSKKPLPKAQRILTEIRKEDILGDYSTREDFETTMRLVSEGKFAIVVSAGLTRKFGYPCAKIRIKPPWEAEESLLELVVKRAQEIGRLAVERFGKNYTKKRDPIVIYIMINTKEIEEIKTYLQSVKNFGYKGLVTFGQEVLPFIKEDGRIVISDRYKKEISLSSNGSGAFISALKTQNLLENMKNNGVEVLQYINLNNFMVPLVDSTLVKAALQKNLVIQVSKNSQTEQEIFPQVLFNSKTGCYEYFNKREVIEAMKEGTLKTMNYEIKVLNTYFHVDLLKLASESAEQICRYRIKDATNQESITVSSLSQHNISLQSEKPSISFELPFFNILQLTKKVKFSLANPMWEAIAFDSTEYSSISKFNIQEATSRFFKKILEVVTQWVPLEYHNKLEKLTRKEKIQLFIISGYCFDEITFINFMKTIPNK